MGLTIYYRMKAKVGPDAARELVRQLHASDEVIAGFTGKLTDALGNKPGAVVAPIKDRADFEHLEARGAEQLANAGKAKRKKRSHRPCFALAARA